MKHLRAIVAILSLAFPSMLTAPAALMAQVDPHQQLHQAYVLAQQGQLAKAIATVQPLIDSNALSGAELGQAWVVLAMAYQEDGKFTAAQNAYERAIHILEARPEYSKDYGVAINSFASLYAYMDQPQLAVQLRLKALHLSKQNGDHTGIARDCSNLAGLELSQNHVRESRKYLKRAMEEMKLTSELDDDDRAAIFSMQGWLSLVDGNPSAAVSEYQHALELWKHHEGEESAIAGWGYMLLGKARSEAGDVSEALTDMRSGLAALDHTLGRRNLRYLAAEAAYAQVLDRAGEHSESVQLKSMAEQGLKDFYRGQCVGCTISAAAFQ